MKATELTTSPIIFDPEAHEYLLIGEDFTSTVYSGVTSILSEVLFPNKYKDVGDDVLARAAGHASTSCAKPPTQYPPTDGRATSSMTLRSPTTNYSRRATVSR